PPAVGTADNRPAARCAELGYRSSCRRDRRCRMQPASLPHLYAVALGSNRRHGRYGAPDRIILAALDAIAALDGVDVIAAAPTVRSAPLGPGGRQFANTVAILLSAAGPSALLTMFKQVERAFGR